MGGMPKLWNSSPLILPVKFQDTVLDISLGDPLQILFTQYWLDKKHDLRAYPEKGLNDKTLKFFSSVVFIYLSDFKIIWRECF